MSPLSGVLTEAWVLYRRYAVHFLTIAFVIYLVTAVIVGLLTEFAGIAGQILGGIIDLIAAFLVQAALVKAVQDVRDGRVDMDFGQTVSAALPFVLPVGVASILAGIGIAIGLALLIVPGLILLTFWSLIVPCIVIAGAGPIESFGQSWRTVRGYGWPAFGTYVLVLLLWLAFSLVLGLIMLAVPAAIRNSVSSIVSGTLVAPFFALVVTLVYYRLTGAHMNRQGAPAGGGYAQGPAGAPPGGYTPPPGTRPGAYTPPSGTQPGGYGPPAETQPADEHTPPPGTPQGGGGYTSPAGAESSPPPQPGPPPGGGATQPSQDTPPGEDRPWSPPPQQSS